jgi:hypothetical protein
MAELNYTKEEWQHRKDGGGSYYVAIKGKYGLDATITSICASGKSEQEQKVNSHLISASPDMYEALKGIYETRNGLPMDVAELARKALAKAEGK